MIYLIMPLLKELPQLLVLFYILLQIHKYQIEELFLVLHKKGRHARGIHLSAADLFYDRIL